MKEQHIEDIISTLYDMIQDARALPLGADKCILERDKVLDMLDEIIAQLPGELKQSRTIVESRNELINQARREAETILRQAQEQAKQTADAAAEKLEQLRQKNRIFTKQEVRELQIAWGVYESGAGEESIALQEQALLAGQTREELEALALDAMETEETVSQVQELLRREEQQREEFACDTCVEERFDCFCVNKGQVDEHRAEAHGEQQCGLHVVFDRKIDQNTSDHDHNALLPCEIRYITE